jgi:hypothetical protein
MAKQPFAIESPAFSVDVAVPVCAKFKTERPLPKVDEALPPTLSTPAIVVDPVFETVKNVLVAKLFVVDAIVKRLRYGEVDAAKMERSALGVEVPMPRAPVEVIVVVPVCPKAAVFDK